MSKIEGAVDLRAYAGTPSNGTTEVQTLTMGSATGGTFTLSFMGATTGTLAYNCAAADIQAALRALPTIGSSGVTVTGGGPFTITFGGNLAALDVPSITVNGAALTGGTAPAITVATAGVTATERGAGEGALLVDTNTGKFYINKGTPQAPSWSLHPSPPKLYAAAGGAAGAHTVAGVLAADTLESVIYVATSSGAITAMSDLTSEFSITGANTIDNTGGTDTTGGFLLVLIGR